MVDKKVNELGDIGMIGLGVMGCNFALNVADHGFVVVGFDRDTEKTRQLEKECAEWHVIDTAGDPKTFCEKLRRPRAIMMLVPAGKPVDVVIQTLKPYLQPGDLINLLTAPRLNRTLQDQQNALRTVVSTAAGLGLPAPALMTALSYWNAYRSGWLPARISEVSIQFRPVPYHTFPATILRCAPITGAGGKGALGRGGAYRRGADPECGSRNLKAYARRLTAFGWEISEIDGIPYRKSSPLMNRRPA